MIDLEKLVPLPAPSQKTYNATISGMTGTRSARVAIGSDVSLAQYTAADMAAFRQQVAQEVAWRCMDVVTRRGATFEPWVTENASNAHRKIARAIAAEFGLGDV